MNFRKKVKKSKRLCGVAVLLSKQHIKNHNNRKEKNYEQIDLERPLE